MLKSGVRNHMFAPFCDRLTLYLVWYQDRVIQAVKSAVNHLGSVQGHQLTRRPFQVTWFSNQLSM